MATEAGILKFLFSKSPLAWLLAGLLLDPALANAQDTSSGAAPLSEGTGSINCANSEVDYRDQDNLTVEERIALMDQALNRSLAQFDDCQADQAGGGGDSGSQASGEGSGSGQAADGSGNDGTAAEGGGATGSEPVNSVSASDMQGTETTVVATPPEGSTPVADGGGGNQGTLTLNNGKIPDDIPPADNDSLLAAQIRKAAENEPDPEKRERLWAEYRKYRGLPQPE
ncbi:hypothetical protein ACTL6U_10875 [Rhodovibrionaceae bacterium A322]